MELTNGLNSSSTAKERFNSQVAVSVALLAAFMAVTKIKDDNIVQAMMQAKSDAIDKWGEYQSKRIKHHLAELGHNQLIATRLTAPAQAVPQLDEMVRNYEAEIARYSREEKEIQNQAKGFEKLYDMLNFRDDQFDVSDAALSISLAMLAVSSLTYKRWLLRLSWLFGGFGVVMGMAGLSGLHLHPDWLTRLLS